MHRVVAHVSAVLAVDVTAEIQAGRGREGAERGGQARGGPAAAVADRTPAVAGRVMVVAEQGAGAGRRQVRSGYSRDAAGPGDIVSPRNRASRNTSARSATARALAGRPAGVLASMS
jgi:hypothetical protein